MIPYDLGRCEECDEAIRRQGSRWVHLAPAPNGGAHDHPAIAQRDPERTCGPFEVYRGRELVTIATEGLPDAVAYVRKSHPTAAISVSKNRRRIVAHYPRSGEETVYLLLYFSTRKAVLSA